ncbi:glucokinase regulatory protein [Theristicus caerulescens]
MTLLMHSDECKNSATDLTFDKNQEYLFRHTSVSNLCSSVPVTSPGGSWLAGAWSNIRIDFWLHVHRALCDIKNLGVSLMCSACCAAGRGLHCLASFQAPFAAGQLDFCMKNLDIFLSLLVGFNPVSMARNDKIEGWHSTFRQVAERMQKLQESHKAFILNPAMGVGSAPHQRWSAQEWHLTASLG